MSSLVSLHAGFTLRRLLELKFKGKRGMRLPSRNHKGKCEDLSNNDPYTMETIS
jgi:hypothetical protein